MNCPICSTPLEPTRPNLDPAVVVEVCARCGGEWYARGQLDALDDSVWTNAEDAAYVPAGGTRRRVSCPASGAHATAYRDASVSLDWLVARADGRVELARCPQCSGCWLDAGMIDRVRALASALDAQTIGSSLPAMAKALAHKKRE